MAASPTPALHAGISGAELDEVARQNVPMEDPRILRFEELQKWLAQADFNVQTNFGIDAS